MTITSSTLINTYTGNGSATIFAYEFRILSKSEIKVTVAGVEYTLNGAGSTGYTVSGVGQLNGGSVTFNTAPIAGASIILENNVNFTQEIDYNELDAFPAESHEEGLDRATSRDLVLKEQLDRTPKFSADTTATSFSISNPVSGQLLAFANNKGDIISLEPASLDLNIDLILTGVAAGDYLRYDGTNFVNRTSAQTVSDLDVSGLSFNNTFLGDNSFTGKVLFPNDGELTISSGAITVTGVYHTVDTESDAATDDLVTINGESDGQLLIIRIANAARNVTLKTTGNIAATSDLLLSNTGQIVVLQYHAELTKWVILSGNLATETAAGIVELATNAETIAGTDTTRSTHPAGVNAAIDGKAVGIGQTWKNVTGSRASNVTYTNNTGKPIFVQITCGLANNSWSFNWFIGGSSTAGASASNTSTIIYVAGIVPDGENYKFEQVDVNILRWSELR